MEGTRFKIINDKGPISNKLKLRGLIGNKPKLQGVCCDWRIKMIYQEGQNSQFTLFFRVDVSTYITFLVIEGKFVMP